MDKLFLIAVAFQVTLCLTSVVNAQWQPPQQPVPEDILRSGKLDADCNRLQEAHEKFCWYYDHAVEIDPSQSAVRHSFLFFYWNELGKKYAPARRKLIELLGSAKTVCLDVSRSEEAFIELAAISTELDRPQDVVEVFLKVSRIDPDYALRVYDYAQSSLVSEKQFQICSRFMSAERSRLSAAKKCHETIALSSLPISKKAAIRIFSASIEEILEILLETQQIENAQHILNSAKAEFPDAEISNKTNKNKSKVSGADSDETNGSGAKNETDAVETRVQIIRMSRQHLSPRGPLRGLKDRRFSKLRQA